MVSLVIGEREVPRILFLHITRPIRLRKLRMKSSKRRLNFNCRNAKLEKKYSISLVSEKGIFLLEQNSTKRNQSISNQLQMSSELFNKIPKALIKNFLHKKFEVKNILQHSFDYRI